jgi:hypothetical protein
MANSITYDTISEYFGIKDKNESIKVLEKAHVFSTNVFIPIDNISIGEKHYLYISGFIKLVETFLERTSKLNPQEWMLFIYYDDMFNQNYDESVYEEKSETNTNLNITIKKNYKKNQTKLVELLSLYKTYIQHIKENKENKYSFVKLYSFNCFELKKKYKGYLGHPQTFGSIIRFLPLFNPLIERVFSINVRHAITPQLVYLINQWCKSEKSIVTNDFGYQYSNDDETDKIKNIINPIKQYNLFKPRIAAGLFGHYKNNDECLFNLNLFYSMINSLILHRDFNKNFPYEIDEIILGYIINCDKKNIYFYKYDEEAKPKSPFDYYLDSKNKSINHLKNFYITNSNKVLDLLNVFINDETNRNKLQELISDEKKRSTIQIGHQNRDDTYTFSINVLYQKNITNE